MVVDVSILYSCWFVSFHFPCFTNIYHNYYSITHVETCIFHDVAIII